MRDFVWSVTVTEHLASLGAITCRQKAKSCVNLIRKSYVNVWTLGFSFGSNEAFSKCHTFKGRKMCQSAGIITAYELKSFWGGANAKIFCSLKQFEVICSQFVKCLCMCASMCANAITVAHSNTHICLAMRSAIPTFHRHSSFFPAFFVLFFRTANESC